MKKTALVTGGSSGLGLALAQNLGSRPLPRTQWPGNKPLARWSSRAPRTAAARRRVAGGARG